MAYKCFRVRSIPDLSLNKYQTLSDTGVEGVLKRHESFLRQWHGICYECQTSFHLLYVFIPDEAIGNRLHLYLILQGEENSLHMVTPLLKCSPLDEFFNFESEPLPNVGFISGATLTKKERIADIFNPLNGQVSSFHYVPRWSINEDARLYDLYKIMEAISQSYSPESACGFRIDLYPASESESTRLSFDPILRSLRGENDIKLVKNTESVKSDTYARDIIKEYEDWITSIETTPHFRVNIYGFADTLFKAKVILNAAGSEALNEGDFSVAAIKPDENGTFSIISRMGKKADNYCFFPKQASLSTWATTFCLNEVIPFFRFPALFDGENIEIPKETAPVQVNEGLYLGKDAHSYPVKFPIKDLARHAFFTGMPGSGKTNTMLHIVSQLRQNHIPFLALEPAKKEYRALLGHNQMRDIFLFSPHLQSNFPLQMNPLEFPKGVRLSEHINALLEVFEGSFLLEGPTYKFLSSSIQRSYTDLGWDIEEINDGDPDNRFPCLQDVYDNLQSEVDASSYDAELKGNVRAFLQVRLGGLMERDAGELFNAPISTIKPEEWIKISAIVELEVLGEQAKNFFVLLVCHYILETLRSDPNGGINENGEKRPLRHTILIEEAHNIIASSTEQYGADSVDPKISATAYIIKMLAEVRALREAIIIADQLPTALASEVTKNTGLKIVHRLTSQDDRAQIGTAISASPLQMEHMVNLSTGKAYIHHEKTMKPFEMQVAEWTQPEVDYDIANDFELYNQLKNEETVTKSITSAFYNWQEKVIFTLDNKVHNLAEKYIKTQLDDIAQMSICKAEKNLLLNECDYARRKTERLSALWKVAELNDGAIEEDFNANYALIHDMENRLNSIKFIEE